MDLDPKEVFMHLRELGYHVTPQQLQEFIQGILNHIILFLNHIIHIS